jgi:hypothetical protein
MPGLVPGIHAAMQRKMLGITNSGSAWMPGTTLGMTTAD